MTGKRQLKFAGIKARYRHAFPSRAAGRKPKAHDHGRTTGQRARWLTIACPAGAQFIGDRTMGHVIQDAQIAVACKGVAGGKHLPLSRGA